MGKSKRASAGRSTAPELASHEERSPFRVQQLVPVFGPDGRHPSRVTLRQGAVVLGREPDAEGIALDDEEASRRHAVVEPSAEGWAVRDLGSHNGTFVDGLRCGRAPLRHGSLLRLGRSLVLFVDQWVLPGELRTPETSLKGMSLPMQRLRREIAQVAPTGVPVLVLGETGVGKELVAWEIHRLSQRSGELVAVNCAAIPASLAESELFGHLSGAFTGAAHSRDGLMAAAHGGTLFLDEIGELPPEVQPKLLRALAEGEVRPVGGNVARRVDARIVSATRRPLVDEARSETFRADLYARLAGWRLEVPPLRERREDILPLALHFLAATGAQVGLSTHAAEALVLHGYPFNVRELERAMEASAVRARGQPMLRRSHLPPDIATVVAPRSTPGEQQPERPTPIVPEALVPVSETPDRAALVRMLEHFGGNVERTASYFGKNRKQIYRWLEAEGIDPADFR
ncbi:MAG: sigma 54-interacting transcriptional regulator [Myxococcaceae bacterium]